MGEIVNITEDSVTILREGQLVRYSRADLPEDIQDPEFWTSVMESFYQRLMGEIVPAAI